MRVLVTGAGGFIGKRLVQTLLEQRTLTRDGDRPEQISEIILTSRAGAVAKAFDDPRLRVEIGDLRDPTYLARLFEKPVDSVFHLAAVLTTQSEADFEYGLQVNVNGLIQLLELCRTQSNRPHFIFASSIATFGGASIEQVDDKTPYNPQTSTGASKAIGELLINDYSRHGYLDGRALRLPFVVARPEPSDFSVADYVGAILREPLSGRDVACPLKPDSCVPLASVRNAAQSLIRLHEIPADRFGDTRAMNMPALTLTLGELASAVESFDYPGRRGKVSWEPDSELQAMIDSWPSIMLAEEANRHGMRADPSATELLRSFVDDFMPRTAQSWHSTAVQTANEESPGNF